MLSSTVDLQGELMRTEVGAWKFEVGTSRLRPLSVNCGIESLGCGNAIQDVWSCGDRDVEFSGKSRNSHRGEPGDAQAFPGALSDDVLSEFYG